MEAAGKYLLSIHNINVLPTILSYTGSLKITKITTILHNPETLTGLIYGSSLGIQTYLGYIATYRLGLLESVQILGISLFVLFFG